LSLLRIVAPHGPRSAYAAISSIRLVDDRPIYSDRSGKVVRETFITLQL
jgi:hypothetical protein